MTNNSESFCSSANDSGLERTYGAGSPALDAYIHRSTAQAPTIEPLYRGNAPEKCLSAKMPVDFRVRCAAAHTSPNTRSGSTTRRRSGDVLDPVVGEHLRDGISPSPSVWFRPPPHGVA